MKIRVVDTANLPKVLGLLKKTFPGSMYESNLVTNLHANNRELLEWVCIHSQKVVAYICFSTAYFKGTKIGFHLAPLAVSPQFQGSGIGTELLSFALRKKELKDSAIYVLGEKIFYSRFGFTRCESFISPFNKSNNHFFALRDSGNQQGEIGYEPEFYQKYNLL